ncbi:hypothetical protein D1867_06285 [Acidianus infernus]|uniref:Uncharacterized protein n=1 Tax=Acidianus infernus TaxID=12915 RepID=A0A6A9QNR2_ACIIN|nr:hypothetical protein [Acidianus infernus]MUM64857.1 hypothetical protein [Acidianus infernus]
MDSFLVIKNRYKDFMKAYENCKKCIDCEACDEAELTADEILSIINDMEVDKLSEEERKEVKDILFTVSSIFDQLRKSKER